jgi:hypothetical protein
MILDAEASPSMSAEEAQEYSIKLIEEWQKGKSK